MNILYINNSIHMGGDNKCILNLCRNFKGDGNKIIVAGSKGIMVDEFLNEDIRYVNINNIKKKTPINILKILFQIRKIVVSENIDIIHSHHRATTLLAKLVSKFTRVKVIHTQHSSDKTKKIFSHITLKNIPIISVSNSVRDLIIKEYKISGNNVKTIYNTINLNNSNLNEDSGLLEFKDEFIVAQIGRLDYKKGIYDFVDIADNISKKNNKIKFVLIGDGPEMQRIKDYIKEKKLEKCVILLGKKDNILNCLNNIDLVTLCSYTEGLPLTPIEAFYKKIPVIGTDIDGINEEIINGFNGYIVKLKDINEFSNRILELYNDREKLLNMGINAYNMYLKTFDEKNYIEKHRKFYQKVLNN